MKPWIGNAGRVNRNGMPVYLNVPSGRIFGSAMQQRMSATARSGTMPNSRANASVKAQAATLARLRQRNAAYDGLALSGLLAAKLGFTAQSDADRAR